MKSVFSLLLFLGLFSLLQGAEIVSHKNMRLDFGKARPYVQQKPFFEVDFGKNPGVQGHRRPSAGIKTIEFLVSF